MKSVLKFGDSANSNVIARNKTAQLIKLGFTYDCKHIRNGEVIWQETVHNLMTDVGLTDVLESYFRTDVTPAFYMGLIDNASYTSGPAVDDTMAQVAAGGDWQEATNYTEGARHTLAFSAAAAKSIASSADAVFTIDTGGLTVKGVFVAGGTGAVSTKSSTAGIMVSAALFTGGDRVLAATDVLNVSYSVTAADA